MDKIIRVKNVDEYVQGVWVAKTIHDDCHIQPVDPPEVEFVSAEFEDITNNEGALRKAHRAFVTHDLEHQEQDTYPIYDLLTGEYTGQSDKPAPKS